MVSIFLLLIIVLIVIIFSVQNATPVKVSFLKWSFEASLSLVIFLSVIAGGLIMAISILSNKLRRTLNKKQQ